MKWWLIPLVAGLVSCEALPRGTTLQESFAVDADQAVSLLRELIRFDTINPPQPGSGKLNANETALLRHVKSVLAADGIASEILESEPGRGNLVARVKGSGTKRPLLLMAHVDVVNVEPSQWEVDPMSGALKDGFIWGRGALDDKDDAAIFVQVLRMLARSGMKLSRDVNAPLTTESLEELLLTVPAVAETSSWVSSCNTAAKPFPKSCLPRIPR